MTALKPQTRPAGAFFLLLLVLGIPIVVFADVPVFPNVPLFAFGALLPATSALVLSYRSKGTAGVVALLRRSLDYARIGSRIWYLPILVTWPLIASLQYGLALRAQLPVPSPHFSPWLPLVVAVLFVAAIGEELGWMGYAFEPMQDRLGALRASVLLGIVWASVHIPYFVGSGASAHWIIWQLIYVATTRVVFVWVYANAGRSIFAVTVMHTLFNTVWFLFPRDPSLAGLSVPSFYDPTSLALTTSGLAALAMLLWDPKTFTHFRYARRLAI